MTARARSCPEKWTYDFRRQPGNLSNGTGADTSHGLNFPCADEGRGNSPSRASFHSVSSLSQPIAAPKSDLNDAGLGWVIASTNVVNWDVPCGDYQSMRDAQVPARPTTRTPRREV